ncbi:MAG: DUF262 domain-containing protein [Bacteroidetes bacterium]|nr:DUF262 domain-containing protein [Bacteroidota bacterium]
MEKRNTPATIAASQNTFSIPLYQRLFEWEKVQITQLLKDLYVGFNQKPNEPYYIGMLTAHNNDLVDGQQRFTVLILMAIVFKWDEFLGIKTDDKIEKENIKIRLSFFAREKDRNYLLQKIKGEITTDYKNSKMETGIKYITDFVDKLDNKNEFIKYVYENLTFFISELPDKYESQDLNKYFEAMNATGKGLENHEILKVNLLKDVSPDNQVLYTKIWNVVSDMDKQLIRPKYVNKIQEDKSTLGHRQMAALQYITNTQELFKNCNSSNSSYEISTEFKSIKEITAISIPPKESYRSIGEKAILNFPEFLLQVLRLQIGEEKQREIPNFFNVHKLQETFVCLKRDTASVELFFQNLLKYRILFDYFIIRVSNKNDNTTNYTLSYKEDDNDTLDREKLIKYQSMLYVSTSSNIWLSQVLSFLETNPTEVTILSLYNNLVNFDNERHSKETELSLKYGDIDRYWFWRLDYYLWKAESEKPKDEQNKAIIDYSFKANRSIEHLHPQTSTTPWDNKDLNSFGNLAMISPEFNSTQSNDDERLKFARIETQIGGKNLLESIKMLLMYTKGEGKVWSIELADIHENEMIDILINSFDDKYAKIKETLESCKKQKTS